MSADHEVLGNTQQNNRWPIFLVGVDPSEEPMDFQLSDAQKGEGVPQDYAEAVKWYRKAAEQGLPADDAARDRR